MAVIRPYMRSGRTGVQIPSPPPVNFYGGELDSTCRTSVRTQPMDEQAMLNRLINVTANSMVEYARNLAAAEFGDETTCLDEVEEALAIAA
jgi:hypothetical protein